MYRVKGAKFALLSLENYPRLIGRGNEPITNRVDPTHDRHGLGTAVYNSLHHDDEFQNGATPSAKCVFHECKDCEMPFCILKLGLLHNTMWVRPSRFGDREEN